VSDETVTIPKEAAQRVFDALVSSMDFGSGFLETDDVTALRTLAVAIGVDPSEGTPLGFVGQYPHRFRAMTDPQRIDRVFGIPRVVAVAGPDGWTTERNDTEPPFVPCEAGWPWCAKGENHPIHQTAEMGA
jgi:hypothetical protein